MATKYDIVIILCASALNKDGGFDEFALDGSYLGGQTRMDAAVDFAPRVKNYIVVGGSKKKINDMKVYLEQKFKKFRIEHAPKIIRIKSDPDTNGNLWAVKLALRDVKKIDKLSNNDVGIMTNFYHLPRAMRFAADIFNNINVNFTPIASEAVIVRHLSTYLLHQKALLLRTTNDINGLRDWENGEYENQDKKTGWCYKCLDKDILKTL